MRKESHEQPQAIRQIVQSEVEEKNYQEGKHLMRLTVGTLFFGGGEALSLPHQVESSLQCFVSLEKVVITTPWTTSSWLSSWRFCRL